MEISLATTLNLNNYVAATQLLAQLGSGAAANPLPSVTSVDPNLLLLTAGFAPALARATETPFTQETLTSPNPPPESPFAQGNVIQPTNLVDAALRETNPSGPNDITPVLLDEAYRAPYLSNPSAVLPQGPPKIAHQEFLVLGANAVAPTSANPNGQRSYPFFQPQAEVPGVGAYTFMTNRSAAQNFRGERASLIDLQV